MILNQLMGSPTVVGAGQAVNMALSFVVFSFLDILDAALCILYKFVDFAVEREWKPCYCSSSSSSSISSHDSMAININAKGASSVLRHCVATNRFHIDSISGTLHFRPSLLSDLASIVLKYAVPTQISHPPIVKILPNHSAKKPRAAPRWSDCDCKTCNSWSSNAVGGRLYVRTGGNLAAPAEDVVFIHGFISSSMFWTETVFPEFSEGAKLRYRLLAVDLLGFGQSPKPEESLYTLMEHVEMIESSVLHHHGVRRFHIVAHSLGSVLALALAARHPNAVLSITLLAPPYFPGEEEGVMRKVAPRRVWPPMAFGASMACWYEHVSRTVCLLICRQHRLWELIFKFLTLNKIRTFLIEAFMCHTHTAAWHTLHNVICGNADAKEGYLQVVREQCVCPVNIIHGRNDDLVPVGCSYALRSKIPRAHLNIIDGKDHISVIVGRQKALAADLENIWAIHATPASKITPNVRSHTLMKCPSTQIIEAYSHKNC